MGAPNSPDLPTPEQAITDAKTIIEGHQHKTAGQKLAEMEFYDPDHEKFTGVTDKVENYLGGRKATKPDSLEIPKYIPTLKETRRFTKRLTDLYQIAEAKLKIDEKRKVTSSQKSSANEEVIEREIDLDDMIVKYTLDVGGQSDGRLHITQDRIVRSDLGEEDTMTEQDVRMDKDSIDIYLAEDYGQGGGIHKNYPHDPSRNEVDENTPRAVQLTEALFKLYLKS